MRLGSDTDGYIDNIDGDTKNGKIATIRAKVVVSIVTTHISHTSKASSISLRW